MKNKNITIGVGWVITIFFAVCFVLLFLGCDTTKRDYDDNKNKIVVELVEEKKVDQLIYTKIKIDGKSMEPILHDGEVYDKRVTNSCEVGDICSFFCLAKRCEKYINRDMSKNVTKKIGDKYWFEGRYDKWNVKAVKKTNKDGTISTFTTWETSFDSTDFGWMVDNLDIRITGVIIK